MFGKAERMLVAALVWLAVVGVARAQEVHTPAHAIPDQYIVVLDDEQVAFANMLVPAIAGELARPHFGRVMHVYEHALRGFAVAMPATGAAALARDPRVRYVEQDSVMSIVDTQPNATQPNATWGLDRVDQRDLPLNSTYAHGTTAANVHLYIIDTGLRRTHQQFGVRAMTSGFTAINDGRGTDDCHGHGTHVAGTAGGTTYGVAKGVKLYAVRVLSCSGSGSTSGVIAGVDWVTRNHASPAVANMSLGGSASTALDDAVRNSVASGVTYAIAAGNSNASACNASPARVSQALTAGSSTNSDARSSFSNHGTCVDLFAPGSSITSAWSASDTATNTISGTSMASPHVAGVAALYLAANPSASPSTVHAAVIDNASANRLSNVGPGSPNRLLYSIFGGGPVDAAPTAAFTHLCDALICTFDGRGSTDDRGIASYTWEFGDGQIGSGALINHTYASSGTFTVRLTVTDTANQTDTDSKSVTVSGGGGDPCTGCERYTGTLSGAGDFDYHPNGSYYYSGVSGTHRGWLRGPSNANFDLSLLKWNGSLWSTVARSEGPTSEEQIAYSGTVGYYLWRVNSSSGSGSYTFWLSAPSNLVKYPLNVSVSGTGGGSVSSSPAGISCGSDCSEAYARGTSVTLTAVPDDYSYLSSWSGGGCSGSLSSCTVYMDTNKTVQASFTRGSYFLTAKTEGTGSGAITSSPQGISCGAGQTDCLQWYETNTIVTLTARAAAGSTFAGWTTGGCQYAATRMLPTCKVTMNRNILVKAAFTKN
jgi:serine protease